jgi:hypothetical protein
VQDVERPEPQPCHDPNATGPVRPSPVQR